uniref:FMRFamide receptor-like n=1 Tax=Pristiophorus japonicus TaxID=55135 RepID=UPI00398EE7DD
MATADLLVLIFDVILHEIKGIYLEHSLLNYTLICTLNICLAFAAIECSVWLNVALTFDRFIIICYQKLRFKYCTSKTAAVIITTVCGLSLLLNIPLYFAVDFGEIIDNIRWFCVVKSASYILPISMAYHWFRIVLTPFAPFVLIALFNALTIRHILQASRGRRGLRGRKKGESHNDPEMENRTKSITLLLAISGSFILLLIVNSLCQICVEITDTQFFRTGYGDHLTIMEHSGYILQGLNSCTNTLIYAVAQTKFRDALKNAIKYPFDQIIKRINSN